MKRINKKLQNLNISYIYLFKTLYNMILQIFYYFYIYNSYL